LEYNTKLVILIQQIGSSTKLFSR